MITSERQLPARKSKASAAVRVTAESYSRLICARAPSRGCPHEPAIRFDRDVPLGHNPSLRAEMAWARIYPRRTYDRFQSESPAPAGGGRGGGRGRPPAPRGGPTSR